jgi:dienelactone hydrolase
MPDLFHGDALPLNHAKDFDFMKWLNPAHMPLNVDPIIESAIRYIQDDMGIERIGGAGYCFGAKVSSSWRSSCQMLRY